VIVFLVTQVSIAIK